jgi:molecular chaperone HtpG
MAGIGKNIIENLTTGMYENSYIIFREYIQNSADSIDKAIEAGILTAEEALIDIDIEEGKRNIIIHDNAMGISKDAFYKKLSDIADSEKDRDTDKGFRGIGRLGGLAFCDKLIFSTSYKGEDIKSTMVWDGSLLREILADTKLHPSASELVDRLISCSQDKYNVDDHFFEVRIQGVIVESDELLDESSVIEYLEAVAPVPYINTFSYKSKIYEFIREENLRLDEYRVLVNGNQLFKQYKNKLYEGTEDSKSAYDVISDVEFKKFNDKNGNLLAWMWFGVSRFEKQIPIINKMRGIRIRKGNIQIGSEETLSYPKFFREPRSNYYFIGELFAIDKDLIPNARRDYFNTNSTLREFELKVIPVFNKEMYNLYHYANNVKKSFQRTAEYQKKSQDYIIKKNNAGFIDSEEEVSFKKALDEEKARDDKARRQLELRKKDAEQNNVYNRVYNELEKQYKPLEIQTIKIQENNEDNKKNKKYLSQSLSKHSRQEQKLISQIYSIIKAMLPKDMADMVVTKIQEELSK